jgi:uncharacterized protein
MTAAHVDTSALLPLLDRDDGDHARVVKVLEGLAEEKARLVTASYTLVEAGALVRNRLGTEAFRALGQVIDRAMEVIWVDADLHRRAWEQAAKEPRRGPSLVDWVGFLLIEEHQLDLALAIDEHFGRRGVRTLP